MEKIRTEKPRVSILEIREKLGPRFDRYSFADAAFLIMLDAIEEFPEETREILIKKKDKKPITLDEQKLFDKTRSRFWKKKFGMNFEKTRATFGRRNTARLMNDTKVDLVSKQETKTERKLRLIKEQKIRRMATLHSEFRNLDEGEIVTEFTDETRRVVYFDEDTDKYYVIEGDQQRYLGVGDLLSDYAWGIKYVPDGEMIEPAYRRVAKRILTNETRRDLEYLHNDELIIKDKNAANKERIETVERKWRESKDNTFLGLIAEAMVRELLARLALDNAGFVVERADAVEDGVYKYDFKVRVPSTIRGVGAGDEEEISRRMKKIGVQFTIKHSIFVKKALFLKVKERYKDKVPVDEIVFVKINSSEFGKAFDRWLKLSKPSGGPEQFLSEEVKKELLIEITAGLSLEKKNINAG